MSFVLSGHRENLGGPTGEQRGISHWNQVSSASSRILAPRSDGAACTGRINGAVQSEKKKGKLIADLMRILIILLMDGVAY